MSRLSRIVTLSLALLSVAAAPPARARVEAGQVLPGVDLPTLAGARSPLSAPSRVSVIVFWRPGQDHSIDALRQMTLDKVPRTPEEAPDPEGHPKKGGQASLGDFPG